MELMFPTENAIIKCATPITSASLGSDVLYGNKLSFVRFRVGKIEVRDYRGASVESLRNELPVDINGPAFVVSGDNLVYPKLENGVRLMEPISWHVATNYLVVSDTGLELEQIEVYPIKEEV